MRYLFLLLGLAIASPVHAGKKCDKPPVVEPAPTTDPAPTAPRKHRDDNGWNLGSAVVLVGIVGVTCNLVEGCKARFAHSGEQP